jgi:Nif-specific regulatory protein
MLRDATSAGTRAQNDMSRLSLLVDLATLLSREVDLDTLLRTACERMAEALRAERSTFWLVDAERGDLVAHVALLPELDELRQPVDRGVAGWVARTGESVVVDDVATDPRFDASVDRQTGYSTRSMLAVPVRDRAGGPIRGVVQVLNRIEGSFDADDRQYLEALAMQLGSALALTTLRAEDQSGPGLVVRGPFNHIVGTSEAMREVYERIGACARTDATVLMRGETGTGKTLLARAIHVNSARQTAPFVTVDCTTLPGELVESELFGHERGAFTGAERRVLGRVELARGGTLFLDEIGELAPAAQGKLLRFLQDRVFERVGGRETLSADVRIVCATHRDLEAEVAAGRFREDLYYRARVVEIDVPALRERGADEVVRLARHFAALYARRYERSAPVLTPPALAMLREHRWPGNVRELEHWIESAVVLSGDGRVDERHFPRPRSVQRYEASPPGLPHGLPPGLTLAEMTRRYVAAAVDAAGGNRTDAARSLGIGRNTVGRILKRD